MTHVTYTSLLQDLLPLLLKLIENWFGRPYFLSPSESVQIHYFVPVTDKRMSDTIRTVLEKGETVERQPPPNTHYSQLLPSLRNTTKTGEQVTGTSPIDRDRGRSGQDHTVLHEYRLPLSRVVSDHVEVKIVHRFQFT